MKYYALIAIYIHLAILFPGSATAASLPQLPTVSIDTTYALPAGGTTWTPTNGTQFQTALDQAALGDVIVLTAGTTYIPPGGGFNLRNKTSGSGWIYIVSSASGKLPTAGTRVTAADAVNMPKLQNINNTSIIYTDDAAHHYRFVGIEFAADPTQSIVYFLLQIGNDVRQTTAAQQPTHMTWDRCYIHGSPTGNYYTGMSLEGKYMAVIDSLITEIHAIGQEAQAINSINGEGPFKIVNNRIEGAGENVMFGGADPIIQNLVPSDIEFRNNHVFKPLSWKYGDPSYAGKNWTVKNLFELKNAQRVLVDGNIFENNWAAAQAGWAIVLKSDNQQTHAPWSVTQDVTFTNNQVLNTYRGFQILTVIGGIEHSLMPVVRVLVRNNLIVAQLDGIDVEGSLAGGQPDSIIFDHNTVPISPGIALVLAGVPTTNVVFTNNILDATWYGVFGDAIGSGTPALTKYWPDAVFGANLLMGDPFSIPYPSGWIKASSASAVGFVDYAGGNYRLAASSPYLHAGTDGKDIGVDFVELQAALAGNVVAPTPPPTADTAVPSVTIVSPTNGSVISGIASVTMSASDNVAVTKVTLFLDATPIGTLTAAPFIFSWNTTEISNDTHSLTAKAYDAAGNIGSSSAVTVTIDNATPPPPPSDTTGPTVAFANMTNGQMVTGKIAVAITATDPSGVQRVELLVNGIVKATDATAPWSFTLNTKSYRRKTVTVTAQAYDVLGNMTSTSINLSVR